MKDGERTWDVAVIGAGPAGLHAAYKAALLNMSAIVIDKGRRHGRGFFAPAINNIPCAPGISGAKLLAQQRDNLKKVPDRTGIIDNCEVTGITRNGDEFIVKYQGRDNTDEIKSKAIVLATGVVDRQPVINGTIKTILPYANAALARYCTICDGHMAKDKEVCVLGNSDAAVGVAIDILYFGATSVTLLTHGQEPEEPGLFKPLNEKSIPIISDEIADLTGLKENKFGIVLKSGDTKKYDMCFVVLGYHSMGTALGVSLGGHVDEEQFLVTNEDCQLLDGTGNPIERVFAVGDVRNTWNQIPIGWGDAEKAVISIYTNYI